ncbi:MAG TPA: hypothetical protein VF062_17330 [Candidatus Limnocylindrales bacterium]
MPCPVVHCRAIGPLRHAQSGAQPPDRDRLFARAQVPPRGQDIVLKPESVDRLARRREDIRLSLRDKQTGQPTIGKRLPDPRHMAVQRLDRCPGRVLAPHGVNQAGLPERSAISQSQQRYYALEQISCT